MELTRVNYPGLISFLGFLGVWKDVFGILGLFCVFFLIPASNRFKIKRIGFLGLLFSLGYYLTPYLHLLGILWIFILFPEGHDFE